MATHDLKELIKCSGYAGTSGQTFRNNVAGAASGAKMRADYIITGWSWTGGPPGSGVTPFATGQNFSMVANFLGGSRIGYIIKAGASTMGITNETIPPGGAISLDSSSTSGSSGAASVSITSPWNTGVAPSGAGSAEYYYGGVDTTTPPASGMTSAAFIFTDSGGASDGLYSDVSFDLYMPNVNAGTGDFNDAPTPAHFIASMVHRDISPADFTIEWHSNSSYTAYVSGAAHLVIAESSMGASWTGAGPDPSGYTLWLRYKAPGSGTWTNYGAVTFYDSRVTY